MDEHKMKELLEKLKRIIADVDKDGDVDRDDIKGMIQRIMSIARVVVTVTPTDKDNKVFDAIVKPIVDAILASL